MKATRPHPLGTQVGQPLEAKPCACPESVGDLRDGICILCGHLAPGFQDNGRPTYSAWALGDHSTAARKRRTYRSSA